MKTLGLIGVTSRTNRKILTCLNTKVAKSAGPTRLAKGLTGLFKGNWRYRVGNYRCIAKIENQRPVV